MQEETSPPWAAAMQQAIMDHTTRTVDSLRMEVDEAKAMAMEAQEAVRRLRKEVEALEEEQRLAVEKKKVVDRNVTRVLLQMMFQGVTLTACGTGDAEIFRGLANGDASRMATLLAKHTAVGEQEARAPLDEAIGGEGEANDVEFNIIEVKGGKAVMNGVNAGDMDIGTWSSPETHQVGDFGPRSSRPLRVLG